MKRQAFVRELEQAGCVFVRHGKRHGVYRNRPLGGRLPRHREIADTLCAVIRKQLGLQTE